VGKSTPSVSNQPDSQLTMWIPRNAYRNTFIVEAIVDIQAAASVPVSEASLSEFVDAEDGYQERKDIAVRTVTFSAGEPPSANVEHEAKGSAFRSVSGSRQLRVIPDRLALSEFSPYTGWDSFSVEALRLWGRYAERYSVSSLRRVAVRYINKIEVDSTSDHIRMEEYFHSHPAMSYDIRRPINKFFMNCHYDFPEERASATITQASVEASSPDKVAVLLDIDVWRDMSKGIGNALPADVGVVLAELRGIKNSLFEACITNRVRELMA
jgi:uncharacterized protein (TIGR04255 family)